MRTEHGNISKNVKNIDYYTFAIECVGKNLQCFLSDGTVISAPGLNGLMRCMGQKRKRTQREEIVLPFLYPIKDDIEVVRANMDAAMAELQVV